MKNSWKTLSSKLIYQDHWIKVFLDKVIDPGGKKSTYAYVKKLPAVIIIPLTVEKEIYLVGQWRYPIKRYSWELPMGSRGSAESLLVSAKRELLEETNLKAKKWDKIGYVHFANGLLDQIGHIYLARDLTKAQGDADDSEKIKIKRFTLKQIDKMISQDKITDGATITAYYKLKLFLEDVK